MKIGIYGANTTGYYATQLLELQGYDVAFYIDITGTKQHYKIDSAIKVYKTIHDVEKEELENIAFLLIAVGNEVLAGQLQTELATQSGLQLRTIFEEPYRKLYHLLLRSEVSYLSNLGFYRSLQEKSVVDSKGESIPWITYPCLEFIKDKIDKDFTVFEWGSGNSTVWWAKRAKEVISVEHDIEWFTEVNERISGENVSLIYHPLKYGEEYCKEVLNYHDIDVVVIDGRDRVNCTFNSVDSLSERGIIIFDNTDRIEYEAAYNFLEENKFKKVDFIGLAPMCDFKTQTSIFYREGNFLGL